MSEETERAESILDSIKTAVEAGTVVLIAVKGDGDLNNFAYTVGNHSKGLPELLIIGPDGDTAGRVLNDLSGIMEENGRPFTNGELVGEGRVKLHVIDASDMAKENFTIVTSRFYGTRQYRVQQVLIPDRQGRLPDDPLCDRGFRVPVLRGEVILDTGQTLH